MKDMAKEHVQLILKWLAKKQNEKILDASQE
jgi:hypothetical protein